MFCDLDVQVEIVFHITYVGPVACDTEGTKPSVQLVLGLHEVFGHLFQDCHREATHIEAVVWLSDTVVFVIVSMREERHLMGIGVLSSRLAVPREDIIAKYLVLEGEDGSPKIDDFEDLPVGGHLEIAIVELVVEVAGFCRDIHHVVDMEVVVREFIVFLEIGQSKCHLKETTHQYLGSELIREQVILERRLELLDEQFLNRDILERRDTILLEIRGLGRRDRR